jgi:hypothetical protein
LIAAELVKRGLPEIESYARLIRKYLDEAYRADLWDIYFIVNGGASADAFDYFRAWLISRGKTLFQSVLERPGILPRVLNSNDYGLDRETWECEEMLGCDIVAYQSLTKGDDYPECGEPCALKGKLTPESELPFKYPDVWRECEEFEADG